MNAPFGLRFELNFVTIYLFARAYVITKFAPDYLMDHAVWLAATLLMIFFVLRLFLGRRNSRIPAIALMISVIVLEVISLFGAIQLAGPEGTPTNVSVIYISGLILSIGGILYSSTTDYLSNG